MYEIEFRLSATMLKIILVPYSSLVILFGFWSCWTPTSHEVSSELAVHYEKETRVEVGNAFIGVEFHKSQSIPQRISFFYPVANSIDRSNDYWTRDTSFVMDWQLTIGDDDPISIGREQGKLELTPYRAIFRNSNEHFSTNADYSFCLDKSAMILGLTIQNTSQVAADYTLETSLYTALKTCHTYRLVDQARTSIADNGRTIYTTFDDPDTRETCVFVTNAGATPIASLVPTNNLKGGPHSNFVYSRHLAPGETLDIIQIIGSVLSGEELNTVSYLQNNYKNEVAAFEESIKEKISTTSSFNAGNPTDDHSITWAKAVLEVNRHYLDGEIVPMPCPAEYNFYFTHDVLVTDLAAVNFDLERVRNDLDYIIRHSDENKIIPHAYYWKDGAYRTEYASSDNWNNFWLILVTASYLRHSADRVFVEKMYPYVNKSLQQALLNLEDDNLMWSYRPDWWDIGHNYGPRTYMTTLAIKAILEYVYLSTVLGKDLDHLPGYIETTDAMIIALNERLWDDKMGYLINYHNDGTMDEHYYTGSLLAAAYGLISKERQNKLINTASEVLLDEQVGVYNAYPMDFDLWREFMEFSGDEAGAKYYYFNGGVWPQGNAWYAMALTASGARTKAADFITRTMSLNGILNGPNGQPVYYEVRNANRTDPDEYGKADKPQFLWAGAWYLYSLYNLYGVREDGWNLRLDPWLSSNQTDIEFTLNVNGQSVLVTIKGSGEMVKSISVDGRDFHSLVLPTDFNLNNSIDITLGSPQSPYLLSTDSQLINCTWLNHKLNINITAFSGYSSKAIIVSPEPPETIIINGQTMRENWVTSKKDDHYLTEIKFIHSRPKTNLKVLY